LGGIVENENKLFRQLMSRVAEFVSARAVEDKLAAVEARGFVDTSTSTYS
jgi:hypothetical protein